ncbi:tetratricopeptide repeat protein [Aquimarina mytili]|uniref:Tetratricopeptide repeat protein n=1 Tax=Aquimarina mytili TaxID=874423 RepID=A0A937D906_9FLAO|nr:tetratricopeptide repeat protein [Aquimarina mytili]MBL0684595.1 tetratricopeptide repeat protein [Aquimarina mytili]
MKQYLILIFCLHFGLLFSQENEEDREQTIAEAKQFVATGNEILSKDGNFPKAEGEYRKAIAKNPVDPTAKYNLANAYYTSEKYDEATQRYTEASKSATSKEKKHKAFHNQGNTYMEQKKYKEAVEAYKNALRNNPKDDETRYNLALAKKMLEEEQKQNDQNKDDQGGDQNQDKDQNQDNKDQKEGDDKEEKKGDQGDKEQDPKDGDQDDKGDQGEDQKDEGDEEKEDEGKPKDEGDKEEDQKGGEGKPEDQQSQPQQVQGQLSPQQVKSLLEAMNNEEKKVQDKINAKKVQGSKVQTDKDW